MKRITLVATLLVALSAGGVQAQTCGTVDQQIQSAHLKNLKFVESAFKGDKQILTFKYSGLIQKTTANLEGRRLISQLIKCNKVKYTTVKTPLSFQYKITLSR